MTPHEKEVLKRFWQIDRALQKAKFGGENGRGFPPTSPWWHRTIDFFYKSGLHHLCARVGRRGGKSSTLCRLAVAEALYGHHDVTPGDPGIVAIVSARKTDALARLRTIRTILDALTVPYNAAGESIELLERPVIFRVFTASIAGVSGFTSIFVLLDECSKWRDKSTGANPANVVIESIVPTMATMPNARMVMISSPMGLVDAHAETFALAPTDNPDVCGVSAEHDLVTAFAPTWIANPSDKTTEARCLKLARGNPIVFAREYAAIPQAEDELSVFDGIQVSKCTRKARVLTDEEKREALFTAWDLLPCPRHKYVATIDPATRGNAWTLIVSCLSDNHVRRVCLAREWRGTKAKPLVPGDVFKKIKELIAPFGLRIVYSDQWSEDTLREVARQHGLVLVVEPWSQAVKAEAYENMRTLFQEERIDLPPDPQVTTDVLGVRQKLTRNGLMYDLAVSGGRHSDYAPAIAMGIMLAKVPPTPLPVQLTPEQQAQASMTSFLQERSRERARVERRRRFAVRGRFGLGP